MNRPTRIVSTCAVISTIVALAGCSTNSSQSKVAGPAPHTDQAAAPTSNADQTTTIARVLRAQDNAKAAAPKASQSNAAAKQSPTQPHAAAPPTPATAPATAATVVTQQPQYPIAGMVGQVNGQAIYADHVFKPMKAQLQALASQLSRQAFIQRAHSLIRDRIRQMVADRLILGVATRDLSDGERRGLDHYVHLHREQLIRQYGRGSLAVAKQNIKEQTGKTLAQTVKDFRQQVIVARYLHQKLIPKINVTRRDIRRYYHNHYDDFNPPTTRTIRLIEVDSATAAKKIKKLLASGKSFKTVARNPLNRYNRDDAGMMGQSKGNHALRDPLNAAMLKLHAGQYAGPIELNHEQWFIEVAKLKQPAHHSLRDVQLQIEQHLRNQQFRTLSTQYREKLFKHGSYNAIPQMTSDLLKIAIDRYAPLS